MATDDKNPIDLGAVSTTTQGGVTGVSDGDSGFMVFPGLADD